MEILDRKKSPSFKTIEQVEIIRAAEKKLNNNIPVYSINAGTQELVKIEFVFSAGTRNQEFPLTASTTNSMLNEGTLKYNSVEIADNIDYYGAHLDTEVSQDFAAVTLYTLNKHLDSTLPIVEELIKKSIFSQHELNTYLQNKRQKFIVNQKKVGRVAREVFNELIFGNSHPYGYKAKLEDFDSLKRDQLLDFYNNYYKSNNCKIIVSGKVNDSIVNSIDVRFGGNDWGLNNDTIKNIPMVLKSNTEKHHLVYKEDAIQSAIRIGKILFNKTHTDYIGMQVLNTIFGGYFGSRLMTNIREDKGYTYGISSGIISLQNAGCFFISTEVGVDVCDKAIHEIYFELGRLHEELVGEEELQLVKNYLLGAFLRSVDGPFALADKFQGIMEYGLGYDYFDKFISTVKNITAMELRSLANKYLHKEDMYELVVGKRS